MLHEAALAGQVGNLTLVPRQRPSRPRRYQHERLAACGAAHTRAHDQTHPKFRHQGTSSAGFGTSESINSNIRDVKQCSGGKTTIVTINQILHEPVTNKKETQEYENNNHTGIDNQLELHQGLLIHHQRSGAGWKRRTKNASHICPASCHG
jgi:hypothetical protein